MIDRQSAIRRYCNEHCGCEPQDCGLTIEQDGSEECDFVRFLKEEPSAQQEPQWIPCNERMPEEKDAGILKKLGIEKRSEDVLATVEVKGERMTITTCTYDGKWYWNMKYTFPDFKVVAWQPIPEPYKGE